MARTAVALAPRSHFCHYVLGRVLLEAAQPAEALVELTVAVRLGGAQAEDGLYRLGLAAKRSGDTDSARQAWTSLLAQQPDHVAARQALRRLPAKTGAS
jgi:predicted Zn-dependent protease